MAPPIPRRGVAELGVEAQLRPLLREPGRAEEPRIGVGSAVRADEEVVHFARRDDAPDRPDRGERLPRRGVELHRANAGTARRRESASTVMRVPMSPTASGNGGSRPRGRVRALSRSPEYRPRVPLFASGPIRLRSSCSPQVLFDAIALELVVERAQADAEPLGGAARLPPTAARALLDGLALELGERADARPRAVAAGAASPPRAKVLGPIVSPPRRGSAPRSSAFASSRTLPRHARREQRARRRRASSVGRGRPRSRADPREQRVARAAGCRRAARAAAAAGSGRPRGGSRGPRGSGPRRSSRAGRGWSPRSSARRPRCVLAAADALEAPLLEHAQELGLELGLELADLVEEERAAVGELEAAAAALRRRR